MKMKWMLATLSLSICAMACAEDAKVLKTDKDVASYAIGVMTARNFQKDDMEVDLDIMMRGMKDGLARGALLMPEKELRRVMNGVMAEARKKMTLNRRTALEENRRAGAKFLAENKEKEGVITLPSGVQYSVIKRGSGPVATDSDLVEVYFHGNLLNGTECDGTEPGKSANLKLSALNPGWREAMKLMPVGSKWKIVVPASLAYGERGVGSDIGPNETLIYEVELVGLKR